MMHKSKKRCLFWDPYKSLNAQRAPSRISECKTCWYVKKPLGFKTLSHYIWAEGGQNDRANTSHPPNPTYFLRERYVKKKNIFATDRRALLIWGLYLGMYTARSYKTHLFASVVRVMEHCEKGFSRNVTGGNFAKICRHVLIKIAIRLQ